MAAEAATRAEAEVTVAGDAAAREEARGRPEEEEEEGLAKGRRPCMSTESFLFCLYHLLAFNLQTHATQSQT